MCDLFLLVNKTEERISVIETLATRVTHQQSRLTMRSLRL